jgi:hypothetical protein
MYLIHTYTVWKTTVDYMYTFIINRLGSRRVRNMANNLISRLHTEQICAAGMISVALGDIPVFILN